MSLEIFLPLHCGTNEVTEAIIYYKARAGTGRPPGNSLVPRDMPVPAGPGKGPLPGRAAASAQICCFGFACINDPLVSGLV